jgi:hypothetical protein
LKHIQLFYQKLCLPSLLNSSLGTATRGLVEALGQTAFVVHLERKSPGFIIQMHKKTVDNLVFSRVCLQSETSLKAVLVC